MPNAVHICQLMTSPPRMLGGQFSAAYIGTVLPSPKKTNQQIGIQPPSHPATRTRGTGTGTHLALAPMPMPRRRRHAKSCGQEWVNAEAMTEKKQKKAEKKMVPRRPK
jgi:hypothetical protein